MRARFTTTWTRCLRPRLTHARSNPAKLADQVYLALESIERAPSPTEADWRILSTW